MSALETLRAGLPDVARDTKLNLQSVLQGGTLNGPQRWGVAVAAAVASRHGPLQWAIIHDALGEVDRTVVEDAKAAACLMAMNNVYFRFRHMIGKPEYAEKRAGLRMNRLVQPATNKTDFELFCLAVSAINGCESCMRGHEEVVLKGGLTTDHVNDAVRIAATVVSTATALDMHREDGVAV